MDIEYLCPQCGSRNREAAVEGRERVRCACGYERALRTESLRGESPSACPWCATTDLYAQKDFPRALGLALLASGLIISSVFYYYLMPIWSMLVLVAFALLDAALYRIVPDVVVCYRCGSRLRRGAGDRGAVQPFDLAVGERYRQERLRAEQLRERAAPPGEGP